MGLSGFSPFEVVSSIQGLIFWLELMSFSQFCLGSIISLELHLGMFYTWCSGHSSAWSLSITTVLNKASPCVSTVFHYKLRITTALGCGCVHILSAHPIWSRSGLVVVLPSQGLYLMQWFSSEIKLGYCQGLFYLKSYLLSQGHIGQSQPTPTSDLHPWFYYFKLCSGMLVQAAI